MLRRTEVLAEVSGGTLRDTSGTPSEKNAEKLESPQNM